MTTIVKSYDLCEFASGRRVQIGAFVNKETSDEFKSLIFTDSNNNRCFVAFSSKLGELTPSQVSSMKKDLQVVEMSSGSFILCKKGQNNWEDVAL